MIREFSAYCSARQLVALKKKETSAYVAAADTFAFSRTSGRANFLRYDRTDMQMQRTDLWTGLWLVWKTCLGIRVVSFPMPKAVLLLQGRYVARCSKSPFCCSNLPFIVCFKKTFANHITTVCSHFAG